MTHSAIAANRIAVSSLAENIAKLKLELDDYPEPSTLPTIGDAGTSINLRNIKKFYGARKILNGLHLDILPGEFLVIIGRSGSGKSTLLRVLAGLERIDSGNIDFGKHGKKPTTRMMFQDSRLLPWKSVLKNVSLGLQKTEASTLQVLHQVGLADRAREWPAVLSGGQRQRVALARALIHEPDLLLLDEPLGALDALTRIEMQALIESVWRQSGFTTVLVTHDVHEAVALADRVILIENGGIVMDKKIDLPRPRNHNGAAFNSIAADILEKILHKPLASSLHRGNDIACRGLFP